MAGEVYKNPGMRKSLGKKAYSLLVSLFINVESESVHTEEQVRAFLILDIEIIYTVHFQVLSYLQFNTWPSSPTILTSVSSCSMG